MKALISGFTASMATGGSQVKYESVSDMLVRALNEDGHTAVRKALRVETNEKDVAEADALYIGLAPFNALGSRYIYGAINAIDVAQKTGTPVVYYVSDWQTHLIITSVRAMIKNPHSFVKPLMQHRTDFDWAREPENLDAMVRIMSEIHDGDWPTTLVPTHPWRLYESKMTEGIKSRRIVHVDPTAYTTQARDMTPLAEIPWLEKQREWTLAALGDYWMKWYTEDVRHQMSWGERLFGGKTFSGGEEGEYKRTKRLKEFEVNDNYVQTWGGLIPFYRLSGSGWWRTRYDFILRCGSIIWGHPDEMRPMGEAFSTYSLPQIETFSNKDLYNLWAWQRTSFEFESKEQTLSTIVGAARDAWKDLQ